MDFVKNALRFLFCVFSFILNVMRKNVLRNQSDCIFSGACRMKVLRGWNSVHEGQVLGLIFVSICAVFMIGVFVGVFSSLAG